MIERLGSLWFSVYLKKVKGPLFGLSPLQQYIVDHHKEDNKDDNPLVTYFYFLAYEKEVWERKKAHELKESDKFPKDLSKTAEVIYNESRSALINNKTTPENTRIKMMLHILGLFFVVTLMLSASAVSTGKLMEMWGEGFGPYRDLAQAFFYVAASVGQWMIYRKTVPEVLKKLFYVGADGWHFKLSRELKIDGTELTNTIKTQPVYSKTALVFLVFCSALLAVSLGMIVLDTSMGSVEEGNVFKSMGGINALAQVFGGVSSFGGLLCVASILCNFALFVNASLKHLFEKATKTDGAKSSKKLTRYAVAALVGLVVLNMFGLTATVMSQSVSTLDLLGSQFSSGEKVMSETSLGLVLLPIFTLIAGICGRGIFNVKAMENLQSLANEMWDARADVLQSLKHDMEQYKSTYRLAAVCVTAVALVFGLSFVGDTKLGFLNPITDPQTILPTVVTLISAITVFGLFSMRQNMFEWEKKQSGEPSGQSEETHSSRASPSPATARKFTLQHDSERRSGQQLFMILGNSVGAGALAASSVGTLLLYGSKNCKELELTLIVFAMIGGGLMSIGSAMNRVNVDTSPSANAPSPR